MIERKFTIATNVHPFNCGVKGYAQDGESMIGIHHNPDGPKHDAYWTVTFIPTGTTINSIFPVQLRSRGCRELLVEFIAKLEAAELPSWLALSTLPWGCDKMPDDLGGAVARIKAAAQA